jgi:hypothetical protein
MTDERARLGGGLPFQTVPRGFQPVGKAARRCCYIRGPEGLLIGLAQELG